MHECVENFSFYHLCVIVIAALEAGLAKFMSLNIAVFVLAGIELLSIIFICKLKNKELLLKMGVIKGIVCACIALQILGVDMIMVALFAIGVIITIV